MHIFVSVGLTLLFVVRLTLLSCNYLNASRARSSCQLYDLNRLRVQRHDILVYISITYELYIVLFKHYIVHSRCLMISQSLSTLCVEQVSNQCLWLGPQSQFASQQIRATWLTLQFHARQELRRDTFLRAVWIDRYIFNFEMSEKRQFEKLLAYYLSLCDIHK